jgi:hypothetical protein
MLDPEGLYEIVDDAPVEGTPVLVHALEGFIDAGHAGMGVSQHLLKGLEHRVLARFDVDQLHDYRARRPQVTFARDHFENYDPPELALHAVRDDGGEEFLLLAGPEPDTQWERFTAAVLGLIDRYHVRLTVGVHGVPMTVPHTRPLGMTMHATRSELVTVDNPWKDELRLPASASVVLELRLGEQGKDAVGYVAHVPHYLADARYPDAILALLRSVSDGVGLRLPVGDLPEEADKVREMVQKQVQDSPEITGVVHALEASYDAYHADSGGSLPMLGDVPSSDEIGAEVESFLARLQEGDGSES